MNPRHPNDEPLDPGQVYALVDQSVASDMEVVLHDLSTATVPLDTLMCDEISHSEVGVEIVEEDNVNLIEGDVTRSVVDGLISIEFSKKVQALAVKSLDNTVVIKLLGRHICYGTLRTLLYDLWKPFHAFRLMDIENDYFFVTFHSREDFLKVVSRALWMVFGHYLIVEPWTTDFSMSQPHPNRVVAWVRFSGLLVTLYKKSMITAIVENIGSMVKIDFQTMSSCRGRFMRLAVNLDLRNIAPLLSNPLVNQLAPPSTEPFGLWMMVERHSRRPYQRASKLAQDETVSEVKGSRFNLIFEEDERAVSTAIMDAAKSIDAHDVCKMPVDSDMVSIAVISTDARDVSMMSIDSSLVSSVALSIVVSPEVARDVGRKSVVVSHSASMIVKPPAKSVVARDREMIIDAPHLVKSQKSLTILVIYFRNLYVDFDALSGCYPISGCFPRVDNHLMESLSIVLSFNEDRQWDIALLSSLFPTDIVPHIIGIYPPSTDGFSNLVAWSGTPSSAFSLALAYEFFVGGSWDIKASHWHQIWSLSISQRVLVFLWLVLRDRLLTNVERARRGSNG
ncbi:hypothetical protein V6N12_035739 [Hibiscus sabdariffa]|uniref:DUF4283 domain-containing protein n=1 Tax=Hibiscus sabdariffa TaxID=183260 RepID=A0ABR2ENM1_9ROSI